LNISSTAIGITGGWVIAEVLGVIVAFLKIRAFFKNSLNPDLLSIKAQ
jgi:hypothetical protein